MTKQTLFQILQTFPKAVLNTERKPLDRFGALSRYKSHSLLGTQQSHGLLMSFHPLPFPFVVSFASV